MWVWSLLVLVGMVTALALIFQFRANSFAAAVTSFIGVAMDGYYIGLIWLSPEATRAFGWLHPIFVAVLVFVGLGHAWMFGSSMWDIYSTRRKLLLHIHDLEAKLRNAPTSRGGVRMRLPSKK